MSSRPLNNDRTNYLIWRYLQEHGHAQTAARFEIDWGNKDPDGLAFSQYIRTHSLVYLLQKGLRYHELEGQLSQQQQSANAAQPFFGPENASAPAPGRGARGENEDSTATTRKHARDSLVNGIPTDSSSLSAQAPAPKRSRRSNGQTSAANGAGRGANKSGDAMEIDESTSKREAASTNSPPATGTAASAASQQSAQDADMELDDESKSRVFHRGAQGGLADSMAGATNSVHAMAPTNANANLGAGGGGGGVGRAGSEVEEGSASAHPASAPGAATSAGGAAENLPTTGGGGAGPVPAPASALSADATSLNHHHNNAQSERDQEQQQLDSQLENQVQAEAHAQTQTAQHQLMPTLKDGRSVGVQSDSSLKAADLGPETAVLRVAAGKNVTHALWSPRDPALLATGGDALCRLWALPTNPTASLGLARSAAQHSNADAHGQSSSPNGNGHIGSGNGTNGNVDPAASHVLNLDPSSIVDLHDDSTDSIVTSMAWSPDGARIAVARHPKDGGRHGEVTIHSTSGSLMDELPGGMELVTNLFWNPSGSLLLGISHSDDNVSTLMVWAMGDGTAIEPFNLNSAVLDATWIDDRSFFICGNNLIAQTTVQESNIEPLRAREDLGEPREWMRICHDQITHTTIAAADETGTLALFDSTNNLHITQAHDTQITAMNFQPLANPNALAPNAPRLFATGGLDGSIKLWDAKRPFELIHSLDLGKESQTLALSFTPDGYLMAAASWDTILFWNTEAGGPPKAVWDGSSVGWQLNGGAVNGHRNAENGDTAMTDDEGEPSPPSLSWDADGGKIAFGAKEQIAIVSFRR